MVPLEETKFDHRLGGRHQAALLVSAVTDALAIVVSEERRTISLAHQGQLYSKTPETLKNELVELLVQSLPAGRQGRKK
jgi:DNA integrity scanning protein DisA with diadenylate cyclase activity